jgi:hypothetical protein
MAVKVSENQGTGVLIWKITVFSNFSSEILEKRKSNRYNKYVCSETAPLFPHAVIRKKYKDIRKEGKECLQN